MKLYISTEMLAVFSLREVELSRRIHCFPTGERERFYSILSPPPPRVSTISPSSSRALQFPATHLLSFLSPTFSRHVHPLASRPLESCRAEMSRAALSELFPLRELRRACFCGSVRTQRSIEQKYARNSTSYSPLPHLLAKRT